MTPVIPAPPGLIGTTGEELGSSEDDAFGEDPEGVPEADGTDDDEETAALEDGPVGPGVIRERLELTVPVPEVVELADSVPDAVEAVASELEVVRVEGLPVAVGPVAVVLAPGP